MPLRLTLKPHERLILDGAVIRNGASRTELVIENEVPVLRESDIMSPRAVRTPCERIVLALQLCYVDPDRRDEHLATYDALKADVLTAAPSFRPLVEVVDGHVAAGRIYQALRSTRPLLQHERELVAHVR